MYIPTFLVSNSTLSSNEREYLAAWNRNGRKPILKDENAYSQAFFLCSSSRDGLVSSVTVMFAPSAGTSLVSNMSNTSPLCEGSKSDSYLLDVNASKAESSAMRTQPTYNSPGMPTRKVMTFAQSCQMSGTFFAPMMNAAVDPAEPMAVANPTSDATSPGGRPRDPVDLVSWCYCTADEEELTNR